jgi:Zn-dependent M28 family amino/carboxypeptidase
VEWLVGLGPRLSRCPNYPAVADFLEAKLASFGLATEQHIFYMGLNGTLEGPDDNGTGTVTLLTAARLLSTVSLDYSVKFVLFAGEEQGMVGSDHWVEEMAAAGMSILGALNFDMMGWWTEGVDFDLEIETNNASRWMADAICWAADTYTTMPYELHVDDSAWWVGRFLSILAERIRRSESRGVVGLVRPGLQSVLPFYRGHPG